METGRTRRGKVKIGRTRRGKGEDRKNKEG